MIRLLIVMFVVVGLSACATAKKEKKTMADTKLPVQCATAEGDLRALQSEKTHVGSEIAAGASAIIPIGLVVNVATGEEGTQYKVMTGEYNKMLDARIAEIKNTCGI
jgi:hypothetical protein